MSSQRRKDKQPGEGDNEQEQPAQWLHITMTEDELTTLKSVISGYLGFLRTVASIEPKAQTTLVHLQTVSDRFSEPLASSDVFYCSYEERMALVEALIGFKLLLIVDFPQTASRDMALAEVERLYQCIMHARSLPPH